MASAGPPQPPVIAAPSVILPPPEGQQVTQAEYERAMAAVRDAGEDEMWLDTLGRNIFGDSGLTGESERADEWKRMAAAPQDGQPLGQGIPPGMGSWQPGMGGAPPPTMQPSSPTGVGGGAARLAGPVMQQGPQQPQQGGFVGGPGHGPGGPGSPGVGPSGGGSIPPPMPGAPAGIPPGSGQQGYVGAFGHPQPQQAPPLQPSNAPWAMGGPRSRPDQGNMQFHGAPVVEDEHEGYGPMEAILRRFGVPGMSSEGESDVGYYYSMKNNQLTKLLAHMRNVWCFVGLFVLLMLVMIPLWNADRLLKDPAYVYFAGRTVPRAIFSVCVCLPILYVCTVSLLFKRGELKAITEQTMLGVSIVFLTGLGLSLMLLSMPMQYFSTSAYKDIVFSCTTGTRTRELYQTSQALQILRSDPSCSPLYSITGCAGFESTPYTEVLEAMESSYRCSGYCYDPEAMEAQAAETAPNALLQLSIVHHYSRSHRRLKKRQVPVGVASPVQAAPLVLGRDDEQEGGESSSILSSRYRGRSLYSEESDNAPGDPGIAQDRAGINVDDIGAIVNSSASKVFNASESGFTGANASVDALLPIFDPVLNGTKAVRPVAPYAATLFSQANWKVSCDGMAANSMRHAVGDMSIGAFYQGLVLMVLALSVGFMQLLGMCAMSK